MMDKEIKIGLQHLSEPLLGERCHPTSPKIAGDGALQRADKLKPQPLWEGGGIDLLDQAMNRLLRLLEAKT